MQKGPIGIITGGLKGIGAATAVEFGRLGGRLALTTRSLAGAEELVETVRSVGGDAFCQSADVRDPYSLDDVVRAVREKWGRIDFIVANAGIAEQTRIDTGDPELWRAVIETNLLGVIYTVHAVLPTMIAQNSGHVIVMSSTSGREPYRGEPVYQASKWGQIGFSHVAARAARHRHPCHPYRAWDSRHSSGSQRACRRPDAGDVRAAHGQGRGACGRLRLPATTERRNRRAGGTADKGARPQRVSPVTSHESERLSQGPRYRSTNS